MPPPRSSALSPVMSSRMPQASPRLMQPYSPRVPSPLGFPPLAPHMAFQSSQWPQTPERPLAPKGPSDSRVHFPPEARRPLAGTTQRPRSQPPPPLMLDSQHHPPTQAQPATAQPGATREMTTTVSPPSPTPSSTSSLSLYSAESITKGFPIEMVNNRQKEEEDRSTGIFCACFNFKGLFGSRPKHNRILAPPPQAPEPAPQTVQVRRRPSPLNL